MSFSLGSAISSSSSAAASRGLGGRCDRLVVLGFGRVDFGVVAVGRHDLFQVVEDQVVGVDVDVFARHTVEVGFGIEILDRAVGFQDVQCDVGSAGAALPATLVPRVDRAFAAAPFAGGRGGRGRRGGLGRGARLLRGPGGLGYRRGLAGDGGVLVARGGAVLVARLAGADPLAALAAGAELGVDDGDLAAVRFTGSSVAGLALVAATYTPSVGLTSGGYGHA